MKRGFLGVSVANKRQNTFGSTSTAAKAARLQKEEERRTPAQAFEDKENENEDEAKLILDTLKNLNVSFSFHILC